MIRVFLRKLIGLGRDEDGAALVITLALLMFMYLTCAGVFAIGQSVKDRIHLQNACDAAAYSAAVIQADTLSRIATINKAMSWTYVSMTKRQQDYIVCRWLEEVRKKYDLDFDEASEIDLKIHLNQFQYVLFATVVSKLNSFADLRLADESFYSRGGNYGKKALARQIDDDRTTITEMKKANDRLAEGLSDRIDKVVEGILLVNLSHDEQTDLCRFMSKFSAPMCTYLRYMDSSEESDFVSFSTGSYVTYDWFPVFGAGIGRQYVQQEDLIAEWNWKDKLGMPHHSVVLGEDARKGDTYFDASAAYSMRLEDSYFGSAGTITVGLAKYNENPWYRVFKDAAAAVSGAGDKLGGIFAAFNPHRSVEWTWALSSAKAGYRNRYEEYDEDPDQPKRAYRVDWKDGDGNRSWNLCVSDWDAVFVPVRSARMKAENGSWVEESGNEDFLREWIEDGNWQPLDGSARHDYAVAGKMPGLPQMHKSGSGLDWKRLADLLYH